MALSKTNKKKRQQGFIFRGKSAKARKRQLLEAILFLTIGINLLLFLKSLPSDFINTRISQDVLILLYESIKTSLSALSGIVVALVVVVLLIFSLILIFGGIIRLFIYFSKRKNSILHRKNSK